MDRSGLGNYVAAQFAPIIAVAGVPGTDTLDGYGPALDSVMAQLGLPPVDTENNPAVDDALLEDARALARYYTLDWLLLPLSMKITFSAMEEKQLASQQFDHVLALRDQAQADVPGRYALQPGDFSFGRLQLDILEPWQSVGRIPALGYW